MVGKPNVGPSNARIQPDVQPHIAPNGLRPPECWSGRSPCRKAVAWLAWPALSPRTSGTIAALP